MLLKIAALIALLGTCEAAKKITAAEEAIDYQNIKKIILAQNAVNEAKAAVTDSSPVGLMSSSDWSPATAITC